MVVIIWRLDMLYLRITVYAGLQVWTVFQVIWANVRTVDEFTCYLMKTPYEKYFFQKNPRIDYGEIVA